MDNNRNQTTAHSIESRRRELWWALQTRVLTDDEMNEALAFHEYLNIECMVPYRAEEKRRELHDAFYQQARLRAVQSVDSGAVVRADPVMTDTPTQTVLDRHATWARKIGADGRWVTDWRSAQECEREPKM